MSPHKSQTKTKCRGKTVISFFPFRETHTHGSNQMETDHFSLFFFSVCPEWVDVVVVSRLVILFVGRWWWWQIGVVTSRNYIYNANTAVGTKMAVWGFFLILQCFVLLALSYYVLHCLVCVCLLFLVNNTRRKEEYCIWLFYCSRSLSDCWPVKSKILVSKEFTTLQLFPISSLFQTVM